MSIVLNTDFAGQVGAYPRIVKMTSTDNLATILGNNYLQAADLQGYTLNASDIIAINYGSNLSGLFTPVITNTNQGINIILQPLLQASLIPFNVTVTHTALATGGAVTLIPSSGSMQYQVLQLQLNSGGTNFSGGGGDRLGQVTDGTTVYSVVPAATMQSLANAQWGATALPNPASAAINTATVAGANLSFKYSGGTTDYSAGSLVITGLVLRVA